MKKGALIFTLIALAVVSTVVKSQSAPPPITAPGFGNTPPATAPAGSTSKPSTVTAPGFTDEPWKPCTNCPPYIPKLLPASGVAASGVSGSDEKR